MTDITANQREDIREYLEANAVGWSNRVTSGELADHLDIQENHDTNPAIREAIQTLLKNGVPIHGNGAGYCILAPGDLEDAEDEIRDRIGALNTRLINLREAVDGYEHGQQDTAEPPGDCAKCAGPIDGDPYLWHSHELCAKCYSNKPPGTEAFKAWVQA